MSDVSYLVEALKPFAMKSWTDKDGWTTDACHWDSIHLWFGPSDFHAASAALARWEAERAEQTTEPASPAPDGPGAYDLHADKATQLKAARANCFARPSIGDTK